MHYTAYRKGATLHVSIQSDWFLFFDQILVSDPLYNHDFQITVSVMEILCL